MLSTERKMFLLNRLNQNGTIQVKEIAQELNISETTIRRDLMELEEEKYVTRVYGGAVKVGYGNIINEMSETSMSDRMEVNYDAKDALCRKASEVVKDGECIFLDGGTTLVPLIDYLAHRPIKIVTHNQMIASRIHNPKAEIIVIGGMFNVKYRMCEGPVAQNMLRLYNFDHAFIGCAGVDPCLGQAYTAEMQTRELKDIAMNNSLHNYLLIEANKLNVKGFCRFANTEDFDAVYTTYVNEDMQLPDNFIMVKE